MWERLLEIVIFSITKQHRKPVDILKEFIKRDGISNIHKLNRQQEKTLKKVFWLMSGAYRNNEYVNSKLATDATHFYTVATTLLASDLISRFETKILVGKLIRFSQMIVDKAEINKNSNLKRYNALSEKHTTDISNRQERGDIFYNLIVKIRPQAPQ